MNCLECGDGLSSISEHTMMLCEHCADKLGLFESECVSCGELLSSEEFELGQYLCFRCIDDIEEDDI